MAAEKQELRSEQKELVAIGAGIGAGCQPCDGCACGSAHQKQAADAANTEKAPTATAAGASCKKKEV